MLMPHSQSSPREGPAMFAAIDEGRQPLSVLFTYLPGPDRSRSRTAYGYRLIYRNPEEGAAGCALIWEVFGGRARYQIALERDEAGELRLHCTCADAVFRAEGEIG